jgi:hypothetical protein
VTRAVVVVVVVVVVHIVQPLYMHWYMPQVWRLRSK